MVGKNGNGEFFFYAAICHPQPVPALTHSLPSSLLVPFQLERAYEQFIEPLERFRQEQIGAVKERKKKFEKQTAKFCASQERYLGLSVKKQDTVLQEVRSSRSSSMEQGDLEGESYLMVQTLTNYFSISPNSFFPATFLFYSNCFSTTS